MTESLKHEGEKVKLSTVWK